MPLAKQKSSPSTASFGFLNKQLTQEDCQISFLVSLQKTVCKQIVNNSQPKSNILNICHCWTPFQFRHCFASAVLNAFKNFERKVKQIE